MRGRNEGTVFHKKRGLWCACISVSRGGKSTRKYRYAKTQQEAVRQLRALQNELEAGRLNEPDRLSIAQYLTWWLDNIAKPNFRFGSWRFYKGLANNHIIPAIGALRLQRLRAHHIDELLLSVKDTKTNAPASPRLRQQVYDFLRKVLAKAARRGTVAANVCDSVDRPIVSKAEMSPLDELQAKALLDAATNDRFFALYALDLNSGLRWGELAGLRWKDIDTRSGMISLQRAIIAGQVDSDGVVKERPVVAEPKSRRGRHIAIPAFVIKVLLAHKKRMLAEGHLDFVFCDTKGGVLRESNFTRRNFKPLLEQVNKKLSADNKLPRRFRFHDLRHTHATFLLKAGVHPKIVSERLGHATVAITLDLYSHVLPSMQRPAVEAMNDLFEKSARGTAVLSAALEPQEDAKAL